MAWTTEEIIKIFRLTIPAMPEDVVSDEELAVDIEFYSDYVSERVFGKLYPKALSYFIAHMRTLNDEIVSVVSAGGTAADSSLLSGTITSEREGDLQRSYASPTSSSSSDYEALLQRTIYGQLFLQIRAMVAMSATIRIGGGMCGCYKRY